MIKILTTEQIRQADTYTILHEPVSSVDLMERAATACFEWILSRLPGKPASFFIFCGPGNNGGDGLVIARLLHKANIKVKVAVPDDDNKYSPDFGINLERLRSAGIQPESLDEGLSWQPSENDFVIDALFGSGLSKPLEGKMAQLAGHINLLRSVIISIDIPSGLFADKPLPFNSIAIQADYTLTFESPKLSFLFRENESYVGEWVTLSIGLHPEFLKDATCNNYMVSREDVSSFLKPRSRFSHKGTYGHSLLIAGSQGKMGAAVLASKACLRTGTGLLTTHAPQCGYHILQTAVPEAMVSVDPCMNECSRIPELSKFSAIGIGPGIGTSKEATNTLRLTLQEAKSPLILDADALNILSEQKTWQAFIPAGCILTPHPGEFARIVGKTSNGFDTLDTLRDFCLRQKVYVLLKGAYSVTCTPGGNCFFNPTGNPGMATGGSGDVLTGIILGFLAQNYSPMEACILGTYIHGLAGDLAAEKYGMESLVAGDIIDSIGPAFKNL